MFHEHNNTYHRTIKIKPIKVKTNTSIDIGGENNNKDSKFKADGHVGISKYKTFSQMFTL